MCYPLTHCPAVRIHSRFIKVPPQKNLLLLVCTVMAAAKGNWAALAGSPPIMRLPRRKCVNSKETKSVVALSITDFSCV
jgi:hypothetical protein